MLGYRIIDKLTEVVEYCDKIEEYKEYEKGCYFDASKQFTIPFENGNVFYLQGDEIEYYYIVIEDDYN